MINEYWIKNHQARNGMAASVELPSKLWDRVLYEVELLHNMAMKVNELINCEDGTLSATGARLQKLADIIPITAKVLLELNEAQPSLKNMEAEIRP